DFETAYDQIVAAAKAPEPTDARAKLVAADLDYGRPTLARSDFTKLSAPDKAFVEHMMKVGSLIDALYDEQTGATALASKVPADPASQSLFRRNRGPKCIAPNTEKDPACSAIPGNPKPVFGIYPADLQKDPKFCAALEKNPKAKELMAPFVVVRRTGTALTAQPITEAYKPQMKAISDELAAAAD